MEQPINHGFYVSPKSGPLQNYTGAPIVGIAPWSVPRIGQGHLEVKW